MQKSIYVESLEHEVVVARRRGTRSLRLSIKSDGVIRLSIPYGVSERQAIQYLNQKSDWILKHHKKPLLLAPNAHVGKSHTLQYVTTDTDKIKTRLTNNNITITLPQDLSWNTPVVQAASRGACEKALKKESSVLLPQRLDTLARQHNITYRDCTVKKLKSRWGSCDTNKNIILNIYLIQLEWQLIDYVILHELAHTEHQHHQTEFWQYLENLLPDWKVRRKELKQMPTDILPTSF